MRFTGWRGGCTGTGSCTLTVTADTVITASFAPMMFTLSVTLAPSIGTVTGASGGIDCLGDCAETLASGTTVTLTATPAPGSVFVGWSGGDCFGTMPCTFTLADTVVTATFAPMMFTLGVTLAGTAGGAVTSTPAGITCGGDCTETLASGTAVTLTAVPAPGSVFAGWSGACSGTGSCMVTMTGNQTVTARFVAERLVVTALTAGSAGLYRD